MALTTKDFVDSAIFFVCGLVASRACCKGLKSGAYQLYGMVFGRHQLPLLYWFLVIVLGFCGPLMILGSVMMLVFPQKR